MDTRHLPGFGLCSPGNLMLLRFRNLSLAPSPSSLLMLAPLLAGGPLVIIHQLDTDLVVSCERPIRGQTVGPRGHPGRIVPLCSLSRYLYSGWVATSSVSQMQ